MPSGKFITLRAKPFKESDLIIDVLSKEGERLTLSAKNALKSKKRFSGGVLEPLHYVEIFYTKSKSGYLYVDEAKILYPFTGLRDDYKKLDCAFYFLKLIGKSTHEGLQDNSQLFDLLGNSLKVLEKAQNIANLKLQFELKYVYYLGFLAVSKETYDFISQPVNCCDEIQLTEEESHYMQQLTAQQLKRIELFQESASL